MLAAVFEGSGILRILDKPIPTPPPQDVLLRVRACGLCGTDLHIYHGSPGSAPVVPPRILGHEFAGEIVALGAATSAVDLAVGDHVTVDQTASVAHAPFAGVDALICASAFQQLV